LNSKSPTILARADTTKIVIDKRIRKLTPLECERLQNIPDGYTASCSDTQRYKMIGNGFNVNTIVHILKGLEHEPFAVRKKEQQVFYTKLQQPKLFA
jgi:site-specific DNA-cytosine methylase